VLGGNTRYLYDSGTLDFDVQTQVYDVAPDGYHQVGLASDWY